MSMNTVTEALNYLEGNDKDLSKLLYLTQTEAAEVIRKARGLKFRAALVNSAGHCLAYTGVSKKELAFSIENATPWQCHRVAMSSAMLSDVVYVDFIGVAEFKGQPITVDDLWEL